MENETLICVDCGQEYELTEGWEKLMKENPDIQPPKRCYDCRQKRKREKGRDNRGDNRRDNHKRERW